MLVQKHNVDRRTGDNCLRSPTIRLRFDCLRLIGLAMMTVSSRLLLPSASESITIGAEQLEQKDFF